MPRTWHNRLTPKRRWWSATNWKRFTSASHPVRNTRWRRRGTAGASGQSAAAVSASAASVAAEVGQPLLLAGSARSPNAVSLRRGSTPTPERWERQTGLCQCRTDPDHQLVELADLTDRRGGCLLHTHEQPRRPALVLGWRWPGRTAPRGRPCGASSEAASHRFSRGVSHHGSW